jgi:hypothetical protein
MMWRRMSQVGGWRCVAGANTGVRPYERVRRYERGRPPATESSYWCGRGGASSQVTDMRAKGGQAIVPGVDEAQLLKVGQDGPGSAVFEGVVDGLLVSGHAVCGHAG